MTLFLVEFKEEYLGKVQIMQNVLFQFIKGNFLGYY